MRGADFIAREKANGAVRSKRGETLTRELFELVESRGRGLQTATPFS